jgi:hypothetical protein
MASDHSAEQAAQSVANKLEKSSSFEEVKNPSQGDNSERIDTDRGTLVYDDVDEEPELHARTYLALLAMFLLNMVQVVALQGPPAVVSSNMVFLSWE